MIVSVLRDEGNMFMHMACMDIFFLCLSMLTILFRFWLQPVIIAICGKFCVARP